MTPKPKPDAYFERWAAAAYDDYGRTTDHKNFQGNPMPTWDYIRENSPTIHQAWIEAVKSVFRGLHVSFQNAEGNFDDVAVPENVALALRDEALRQKYGDGDEIPYPP